ncbi:MAG: hypothetical protein OEY89_10950 [Gammaproteobacteria bacterium]|nr:hypothetical protein [Gammaproteobacteria bacterium]
MGHFFAITAIKATESSLVVENLKSIFQQFQCEVKTVDLDDYDDSSDALVYQDSSGWIVINWPSYFNIHDQHIAQNLSKKIGTIVSTISVYEGALWTHVLYENGDELHRFCNVPDYFDEADLVMSDNSETGIKLVAEKLSAAEEKIKGYFTYLKEDEEDMNFKKVHDNDEFEIWDFWVFCDFWKQVGINYPEKNDEAVACLRLCDAFDKKLPVNKE